ncbi:MAG: IS256 family transposase [Deltaproteobacteria bacterium]|nr:IS256 family transposase [Deltaproteobacteria bacterium]
MLLCRQRCKTSVSEIVTLFKEIQKEPSKMFELIRTNIKEQVGNYISELLDIELKDHLKRNRYERSTETDPNYRNGSYNRKFCIKSVGETTISVPRDRKGSYKPKVLPRFKRYEDSIKEDLTLMYLTGISTRSLSLLSNKLIGRKLSPQEVSNANKELISAIEKWRTRDLSAENIKYIYLDGVNFHMRIKKIETVPVLVAIGVDINGYRSVLGFQSGDKESASSWRQFFKDLKNRGLNGSSVKLGIMDGLAGLEKVFKEEFYNSSVQRCQVHLARNVLSKVPIKHKKEVADGLRSIFYAMSKDKAMEFFKEFKNKYDKDKVKIRLISSCFATFKEVCLTLSSAVKSLSNSIDSSLTFFKFPQEDWISLRTTNIIERLNKEFKRRTKSMIWSLALIKPKALC